MVGPCSCLYAVGGGKKRVTEPLDIVLMNWIDGMRAKNLRVSRRMIREKARELSWTVLSNQSFNASRGWLEKFMERQGLSLRRRTTVAQKTPDELTEKLVSIVLYVRKLRINNQVEPGDIIAMDETAVWFDMLANTTVDYTGAKSVALKTTGHEKARLGEILAAKGDGSKLNTQGASCSRVCTFMCAQFDFVSLFPVVWG